MSNRKRSLGRLLGGFLVLAAPGFAVRATAQAVGFAPVPAPLPSGVSLNVTPAVSADRRYVRLGVDAGFSEIQGFTPFSVPAAVGGGAAGMNGPIGGGGVGAAGGGVAQLGGLLGGLGAAGMGNDAVGMSGFPYAFAVSGGYGPLTSWNSYGVSPPAMLGYGLPFGGVLSSGVNGMAGPGMGMPGLAVPGPGQGQPLTITAEVPQPGMGGDAADPFDQARARQGPGLAPPPGENAPDRGLPRSRSARSRGVKAPRRAASPRHTQAARARKAGPAPAPRDAQPGAADFTTGPSRP